MSHEVGNTVGAGRSLLESCLAYGRHLPEAEQRDFEEALSVVISRLGQLQEFTRGFAEVVRLPPPRLGPCDLGVVARAVATLLRPAAEAQGTRLEVEADPAVGAVAADRTQLEQALVNVGKNALEAAGPGGRVAIRVASRGGRAVLEVEDSGPGIPPEAAAQIFTPFFSTKEQGQGPRPHAGAGDPPPAPLRVRARRPAGRADPLHGRVHCLMSVPSRRRISPHPPFSLCRSPCSPWPNGYLAAARSSTSMPQPGASFA